MSIIKGKIFNEQDIYIDYEFEKVMFRYDHLSRKAFKKFYGEQEICEIVPHYNRLYNDALLYGEQITELEYQIGKPSES